MYPQSQIYRLKSTFHSKTNEAAYYFQHFLRNSFRKRGTTSAPYQMKCQRDTCQERWKTQIKDSTFTVIATKPSMCHCQPISVNEPCSVVFHRGRQVGSVRTCWARLTEESYYSGLCHREAWLFFSLTQHEEKLERITTDTQQLKDIDTNIEKEPLFCSQHSLQNSAITLFCQLFLCGNTSQGSMC